MKKLENLITNLFSVYAYILLVCIGLYWIFKYMELDITLASNLLIWSATIFAPIVILLTYKEWQKQKAAEVIADMAKNLTIILDDYHKQIKLITEQIEINIKHQIGEINVNYPSPNSFDQQTMQGMLAKTFSLKNRIDEYYNLMKFENQDGELISKKEKFDKVIDQLKIYCFTSGKDNHELFDKESILKGMDDFIIEVYKYVLYRKIIIFNIRLPS